MADYTPPAYNNIIIGADDDPGFVYSAPSYNNIIINDTGAGGVGRYAMVIYDNHMITISTTLLGTGLQPIVLEEDGSIHTRSVAEGIPLVEIAGQRTTLPAEDYLLI